MKDSHKVPRHIKDKKKRKPAPQNYVYASRIVRKEPPKGEKKIIARQELIKDETTGKAKYHTVYEVKDSYDDKLKQKMKGKLYLPAQAPVKEFRYYRDPKPQFKDIKIKYDDPSRYGSLDAYKKSKLIQIAKDRYGLNDKMSSKLDKEEIIDFIQQKYQGQEKPEKKYVKQKIKLAPLEPVRNSIMKITPSPDPRYPYAKKIEYGVRSGNRAIVGRADDSAEAQLLRTYRHFAEPFGSYRKMDDALYNQFNQGNANLEEIIDELATHLDMPDSEKLKLAYLTEKQLLKLYKKTYKLSLKEPEERFEGKVYFPKFEMQQASHIARAPQIKGYLPNQTHIVGQHEPPYAYHTMKGGFDINQYNLTPEQKKLNELQDLLQQTTIPKEIKQIEDKIVKLNLKIKKNAMKARMINQGLITTPSTPAKSKSGPINPPPTPPLVLSKKEEKTEEEHNKEMDNRIKAIRSYIPQIKADQSKQKGNPKLILNFDV